MEFQLAKYFADSSNWYSLFLSGLDVSIVAFLIYRSLILVRGTRAASMLAGLFFLIVLFVFARTVGLVTVVWMLERFLSSIILIIIVVFQEDIRRGLTKFGTHSPFKRTVRADYSLRVVEDVVTVCSHLAKSRIGALMVFEREVGLDNFIEDAVVINANVNRKLLYTLFVRDSALHDGAVLIQGDKIKAAGCVLPLSFDPDLDPTLGTRHRAGIGLSQRCDALIIIVSEETGRVSAVHDGKITRNLDPTQLREMLLTMLSSGMNPSATSPSEGVS
jgi:diadenylate cyclase